MPNARNQSPNHSPTASLPSNVPVLSKIPYVNRLFKKVGYHQETYHMLVLATPTRIHGHTVPVIERPMTRWDVPLDVTPKSMSRPMG